jgi:zinc-binding alcohol dehydrogenase/oxidoreductase
MYGIFNRMEDYIKLKSDIQRDRKAVTKTMKMMKAMVHDGKGMEALRYTEAAIPELQPGWVRVRLKAAALNHRDLRLFSIRDESSPPMIFGSDGAGVIDKIGFGVTDARPGDEVILHPSLGWPHKSDAPPKGFRILGDPDHGTFAEFIAVPAENVIRKPTHLSWTQAAALPLSALTAYRALFTRAKLQQDETVVIPGIGGAVALYALLFAKKIGATVIVTSRHADKLERSIRLGADYALDTAGEWSKEVKEITGHHGAHVVVETVGGVTWEKSLDCLRLGGRLVSFAAGYGSHATIDLRKFFYGQYSLLGTTMGSRDEFIEMVKFVESHGIHPVVDSVYPLSEAVSAFKKMEKAAQFGKLVLEI